MHLSINNDQKYLSYNNIMVLCYYDSNHSFSNIKLFCKLNDFSHCLIWIIYAKCLEDKSCTILLTIKLGRRNVFIMWMQNKTPKTSWSIQAYLQKHKKCVHRTWMPSVVIVNVLNNLVQMYIIYVCIYGWMDIVYTCISTT